MQSLVQALRANNDADLKSILGKEAGEVLSSGDEVADKNRIEKFLTLYDQAHRLERVDDDTMNVVVGDKDWPMPIPIVRDSKEGKWYFDTDAGKEELLNRRIGQNELDVIQVCEAIVDAQREYAERDPDNNGIPEYARKFLSDPGKKNGLYWPTEEGEAPSPLGPLVANAVDQGYSAAQSEDHAPAPYHGYYYRILTEQGDADAGGRWTGGSSPGENSSAGSASSLTPPSTATPDCDLHHQSRRRPLSKGPRRKHRETSQSDEGV